jgi:uncharacterized damage-inducible protein DinB
MNPYAASLGNRDVLDVLATTPERIRMLVSTLGASGVLRSHAPGKWNVEHVLVHLAQTELVFGLRARMAVTADDYVVQPMDQDRWMAAEPPTDATTALAAYEALRAMNLAFFRALTPEQRSRAFVHPERGAMQVWDIAAAMAGHELHHLGQIESVAAHL